MAHAALGLGSLLLEGPLAGPEVRALGTELGSTVPAPQAQAASREAAGPERRAQVWREGGRFPPVKGLLCQGHFPSQGLGFLLCARGTSPQQGPWGWLRGSEERFLHFPHRRLQGIPEACFL